jgi:hypothetical protein
VAARYGGRPYDVSGNGERFLVVQRVDAARPQQSIVVVQNWLAEFEHRDRD